jgi:protein phosphatase
MKVLNIQAAGLTDAGTCKSVNQDNFVYKIVEADNSYAGIFAVADGVGGLDRGEVASTIAISNINKWWNDDFKKYFNDAETLKQSLILCFKKSNEDIIQYSKQNNMRTATTLSALLIHKNMYYIVHTGDSRIYRIDGKIELLTVDQSCYINKTVNGITYRKSVLTDCLGSKESLNCHHTFGEIYKNQIFVLCSDGIYKTIEDAEIHRCIKRNKNALEQCCLGLVNEAKNRGETDNITLIIAKIVK